MWLSKPHKLGPSREPSAPAQQQHPQQIFLPVIAEDELLIGLGCQRLFGCHRNSPPELALLRLLPRKLPTVQRLHPQPQPDANRHQHHRNQDAKQVDCHEVEEAQQPGDTCGHQ